MPGYRGISTRRKPSTFQRGAIKANLIRCHQGQLNQCNVCGIMNDMQSTISTTTTSTTTTKTTTQTCTNCINLIPHWSFDLQLKHAHESGQYNLSNCTCNFMHSTITQHYTRKGISIRQKFIYCVWKYFYKIEHNFSFPTVQTARQMDTRVKSYEFSKFSESANTDIIHRHNKTSLHTN